ncbi:MAG: DUF5104 domain-containing protein [Mogibacterium diversum]|nr:DUF5104 domain-containing protein [Mogibacterium diversum]
MKKIICVTFCMVFVLSTAVFVTSCKSRTDEMGEQSVYAEKQMKSVNKKIVKCINNKDEKGLKSLFSKNAQKESEELDNRISELISAFNGVKIKSFEGKEPGFSGDSNTQPINIYGFYTLNLSNGDKYVIWVDFCSMDDENKEDVGIYMIEMIDCTKDKLPSDFKWDGINNDKPGVFIHHIK